MFPCKIDADGNMIETPSGSAASNRVLALFDGAAAGASPLSGLLVEPGRVQAFQVGAAVMSTESLVSLSCARCGSLKVAVRALGQTRYRCTNRPCEAWRVHRRQQQKESAMNIEHGPLR